MGDASRASSYETTSGVNVATYTGGQVTNANLPKSNISLGKSEGAFETTVQRSFKARTVDEIKNAQVNTASTTQMRTEIDNGKQKDIMVSASHAAMSNVEALYDVKFKRREGRHTNISLGTQKHHLETETGTNFIKHGAAVYTAPLQKQEVSWNALSVSYDVLLLDAFDWCMFVVI